MVDVQRARVWKPAHVLFTPSDTTTRTCLRGFASLPRWPDWNGVQ